MTEAKDIWYSRLKKIIRKYGIDTNSTREITIPSLQPSTHVYEVTNPYLRTHSTHIIETEAANRIISSPSLVGWQLSEKCFEAAREAVAAIHHLTDIDEFLPDRTVYCAFDRAGPYYGIHTVLGMIEGLEVRTVSERPRYTTKSYINHLKKIVEIKHGTTNFRQLPRNKDLHAIIEDTGASGKTFLAGVPELVMQCKKAGSRIGEMTVYGFQSSRAMRVLRNLERELDLKINTFPMVGIMGISENMYDMPLYGFNKRGHRSTVHQETLLRILQEYKYSPLVDIDVVGDWSAKFINIPTHLTNTIERLETRMKVEKFERWQVELALQELRRLRTALLRFE